MLSLLRASRHRLRAAADLRRAGPTPILVYQMGKVGSTSVCDALLAAGLHPLQVHSLAKRDADSPRRRADRAPSPPFHRYLEHRVGAFLERSTARVKVITLVRDPIARVVSNSYEIAWQHGRNTADAAAMQDFLAKKLSQANVLKHCYNWFDEEMKAVFGIDVHAAPFDPDLGHQSLAGQRADLLLLKLEKLDALWPVLGSFVGREVTGVHSNVRSRSRDGESYRRVRAAVTLPRERVRALYDHPWMRHFYSESEITAFIDTWSGTPHAGPGNAS